MYFSHFAELDGVGHNGTLSQSKLFNEICDQPLVNSRREVSSMGDHRLRRREVSSLAQIGGLSLISVLLACYPLCIFQHNAGVEEIRWPQLEKKEAALQV
jgi:hypothetical protein